MTAPVALSSLIGPGTGTVALTTACPDCGKEVSAVIGGGAPKGAYLRANHQPDGTHRPGVYVMGARVR